MKAGNPHADPYRVLFRTMAIVVAGGVVLMGTKFTAWYFTRSTAILTDALESIINVAAASFALFSIYLTALPRDKNHPYGHGKVEYFAAGFEGAMIILAAGFIFLEAIRGMIEGHAISQLDLGLLLSFLAGLGNLGMGYLLLRAGKKHHSITLEADGKHLISDTLTSAGLVIGLLIVRFTGLIWLDSALAILLALMILITGLGLIRKSIAGLMDEADFGQVEEVIAILNQHRKPEWIDIHNMRIQRFGRFIHIDCHVTLAWYYTLERSHEIVREIEDILNQEFKDRVEIFIHADPCLETSCAICGILDCESRRHPHREKKKWTLENVTANKKHA